VRRLARRGEARCGFLERRRYVREVTDRASFVYLAAVPGYVRELTQAGAGGPRERLLAAVIEVVAVRGYARASTAETARAAEVSKATFYRHFRGKRECFVAACDEALAGLLDDAELTAAHSPDWSSRVRAVLRLLLERLAADPPLARAWVVELPAAGRDGYAVQDRAIDRLATILAPGPGEGRAALPRSTLAQLLGGGVWELVHATVVRGSPAELPALLPDLHEWIVRPACGRGA
jgi:AcrR family transcriptional regulator